MRRILVLTAAGEREGAGQWLVAIRLRLRQMDAATPLSTAGPPPIQCTPRFAKIEKDSATFGRCSRQTIIGGQTQL